MKIVVLASGSKGNATYVETEQKKILIDAGISMLQIRTRLAHQNIILERLDAVFITHEHIDHTKELVSILTKTGATLYINQATYQVVNKKLRGNLSPFPVVFIEVDLKYFLDNLLVVPIQLSHDAVNTYGYLLKEMIAGKNYTFATITDTGYIPVQYLDILATINVVLIEANHDLEMLENSGRPWHLIRRISSNRGHMSNNLCMDILRRIKTKHTKKIILGHISEDCNDYRLVYDTCLDTFKEDLTFDIIIAYQYEETALIEVA